MRAFRPAWIAFGLALLAYDVASADEHPDKAAAARPWRLDHDLSIAYVKPLAGYVPGAVVRPVGDERVSGLPKADGILGVDLRLALGPLSTELRPYMMTVRGKNGPKVVGLHYEVLLTPFACARTKEGTWDLPWRKPCVELGYAHRSDHNQDDGTFSWTYSNGAIARMRLWSKDEGRSSVWLWGQLVLSEETPFALTESTDIAAKDLETRVWLVGMTDSLRLGEDGELSAHMELRGSAQGAASFGKRLRYLHDFGIGPGSQEDPALTLRLGVEGGFENNLRKREEIGGSAFTLNFVILLPLG